MLELVGYPSGQIIKVSKEQFNKLNELDLVQFDDEWTPETPNGQWGFNDEDEQQIRGIINQLKLNQ
jgi:hypothetical protein